MLYLGEKERKKKVLHGFLDLDLSLPAMLSELGLEEEASGFMVSEHSCFSSWGGVGVSKHSIFSTCSCSSEKSNLFVETSAPSASVSARGINDPRWLSLTSRDLVSTSEKGSDLCTETGFEASAFFSTSTSAFFSTSTSARRVWTRKCATDV